VLLSSTHSIKANHCFYVSQTGTTISGKLPSISVSTKKMHVSHNRLFTCSHLRTKSLCKFRLYGNSRTETKPICEWCKSSRKLLLECEAEYRSVDSKYKTPNCEYDVKLCLLNSHWQEVLDNNKNSMIKPKIWLKHNWDEYRLMKSVMGIDWEMKM
jgi:hypothetical protein